MAWFSTWNTAATLASGDCGAAGLGAVFACPLRVGGIRLGVLDLYRTDAGVLAPEELGYQSAAFLGSYRFEMKFKAPSPRVDGPSAPAAMAAAIEMIANVKTPSELREGAPRAAHPEALRMARHGLAAPVRGVEGLRASDTLSGTPSV